MVKAQRTGRGGDLAVLHHTHLQVAPVSLPNVSTFECLAFKCKHHLPVTLLLIYRPPKPHPHFISEINDLLMPLCSTSTNVVILGDFKIYVNSPSCLLGAEIMQMLDCLSLKRHTGVPAHTKGHTLDLVIIDSIPIKKISQVYDMGVSDHKVIALDLTTSAPYSKSHHQICHRNLNKINPVTLSEDLNNLSTQFSSVDDCVEYYDDTLLGNHAPIKTRTVTFSHSAPWFKDEQRFIASYVTIHKIAYCKHQKHYSKSPKSPYNHGHKLLASFRPRSIRS